MEFPFRIHRAGAFAALLAVTGCPGTLRAANLLTATPSTLSLTCSTATGPGTAATVVVKPAVALTTGTIQVSLPALSSGLVVTAPASATLNASNQAQGLTYTVNLAAGCVGATAGLTGFKFNAGSVPDVAVAVNVAVTAPASPLVAAPVMLTCTRFAGSPVVYAPGSAQTVTVSSAAPGGTPFTVNPSGIPAWLVVTPLTGGTADATGVALTVAAIAPCGNYAAGSTNSVSIHLKNAPSPDGLIPVTLQILGPSPLTAAPKTASLMYTKGSAAATVDVALSAGGSQSPAFAVDAASLPIWLTVDALSGAAPQTLHFSTTAVADTIATGAYAASVHVKVTGYADLLLPFSLLVSNPPPKLTVAEGVAREISWTVGQPAPLAYVTVASTGSAVPYTITTGGAAGPIVSASLLRGLAYSSGTPIPVVFDPAMLAAVLPGTVVAGTVTFAWGSPASTLVVTFNVTVLPAPAALLAITPSNLPTAAAGQTFSVVLTGTGFVASGDPSQQTFVGIVSGGSIVPDSNLIASVTNPSNIIVTIQVPAAPDAYLPFSTAGTGGTVILGVCNPMGATCTTPTGTAQLTIGVNPVVQAVTSASAFLQVSPPELPAVAPYDIISIFGTSFCASGGSGCDATHVLYGTLDPATLRYPFSLSPDPPGATQRLLTVTFQTHTQTPMVIGKAPLLFATNNQINLLVPSTVAAYAGKPIDIVVAFGYGPAATTLTSAPFAVNVVAANPGIFTVGADGAGEGAILALDWSMVTTGNEAAMRANPADSDTVQIYVTGLGVPDSMADATTSGTGLWPTDCVGIASYLSVLNGVASASSVSVDGAVIASSLLAGNRLPPCLRSAPVVPSVTVGGQPAMVTYAGWVPDSVAGQYQINVRLPGTNAGTFTSATGDAIASPLSGPVKLPVVVTARGRSSQPGVTIWVAPRLKVSGPAGAALHGTAGALWPAAGSLVMATGGTGAYAFAVSGGSLPAGLKLNVVTGVISGTPAADSRGSYVVTVTATDSAAIPLTGRVTFILKVE